MSARRTGYGIDLNDGSAMIARVDGPSVLIFKNDSDSDSTPCVVSETHRHALHVGQRAVNNLISDPENTVSGFYRHLGTSWKFKFQKSGREMSAEELTAEVFKSLRADVQQRTGEVVEASVITVPAAFELHQCDAMRKAAQLAGFKESPLLQEPVAAALAYGFQVDKKKACWLVYDFGDATFDAAIIKAEEGTLHVVNHGGDNFLGGSDMDWSIVEQILVPRLLGEFDLKNFTRGNKQWRQAFAILKRSAEIAKIDLSRNERATLGACKFKDSDGEEIEFDCELSRAELLRVAEPFIVRSAEICKRVLKEKNLGKDAVEKVILVGGPTLAPYFRELLGSSLGIPLDHSVDPLTVVARGAAVFASTQRFTGRTAAPIVGGEYSIDLRHKPVGMDSAPMAGGKVSGPSTEDFTGFTLELVNMKTQWRSGKISLRADGVFIANLHVERGERNNFAIELFDPSGIKQRTTPDTLTYTIGIDHIDQPLINSIGIALGNNTVDRLFSKGQAPPLKVTRDCRIPRAIRQGSSDAFRLPIVEGESASVESNRLVGTVEIRGDNLRKTIPAAAEVEITFRIDTSRILTVQAYVPELDEEFVLHVQLGIEKVEPDEKDLERKRFRSTGECKALLAAATPEMFRANAFRITGLPVDATTREITKHADKLKMMEELGQGKSAHTGAFSLAPPPSIDQIRDAIQCLRDPERRLLDEFFWFWPDDFGSSVQDPAIQALAGGDRETALEIWTLKETSPTSGVTAMHNVAVLWQLVALEWEEYAGQGQIDDERRRKIDGYWRNSFKRWELLAVDDLFWDNISARIKQIDDPRLTTGFGRRMRATLPQALDKINAELAVRYAESGRMDMARVHVQFMRETNQGLNNIDKTAELVLAPTTIRLKQQIDRAQQRATKNPADAISAARELLNHAPSSLILFELFFGKESEARNELSDEVAALCNKLQLIYHKTTGDNKGCFDLLRMALPFATSTEVRQQIENNIGTLNSNIAYAQLEPILSVLHGIDESTASPNVKLGRIKQEIIPTLAELIRKEGSASNSASEFANSIAISLRSISISAYNDHDDIDTALEAIATACDLARDSELKKRLLNDKAQITRNRAEEEKRNLLLEIRSDTIEVTREKFRYNSHVIPANDINGVRFGVFTQYTNGIKSSVSYKVAVSSARHGTADIECKRFFRDEDKATADFQAIVGALYCQIIPALCSRLATSIVAGARIALGDCTMTNKGILATTGMLLWKEDHVIPWSDVRFGTHAGHLNISSAQDPKVTKSFVLREVWNAVIIKELANAVVTLQGKQRTS